MKNGLRSLVAIICISVAPLSLAAQDEEVGKDAEDGGCSAANITTGTCVGGGHAAWGPGGNRKYAHGGDCKVCSTGIAEDCHPLCTAARGDEELYAAIVQATRADRINDLISIAPIAQRYVSYNTSRGTLQVKACDGVTVIANIKLSSATVQAYTIAMARPNARTVALTKLAMLPSGTTLASLLPKADGTYGRSTARARYGPLNAENNGATLSAQGIFLVSLLQ